MPSVVSTSSATATSSFFPLFQPSQAGKAATVKPSQKTPYDRSSSVSKKKEEDEDLSLHLSILHRPPPSFPLKVDERSSYLRPEIGDGKSKGKVTAFQWKLYDLLLKIPSGKVSTYGQIATLLSSSPRAVGSALRNNPFAPTIPCHRVLDSKHYIGGFGGEWPSSKGAFSPGPKVKEKLELLRREGVEFDGKGYLKDKKRCLWDGKEEEEE